MKSNDFQSQIQAGVSQYHQPKEEGDIDLIQEVRTCLMQAGLHAKLGIFDNNRFIQEGVNKPSEVQRYLLNRFWQHQLLSSGKPAVDERYCLIPNGSVHDWLKLFKQKVLPFVLENNLPV